MTGKSTINETINTIKAIFEKHKNERVCVITTTCVGKTTLVKQSPDCVDVDDELGVLMTAEEIAFVSQVPWTKDIGDVYDRILFDRVKVKPGHPLFGSVILDCEVIVFLDISNELLSEHCKKRGVDLDYALSLKREIEKDWNNHKGKNEKTFYYVILKE